MVAYKIITKVLANRLKKVLPNLISAEQTSFVPSRNITDSIIVAQEVVHNLRKKKVDKYVAIKIDLQKAYDKLRWEFIEDAFKDAKFLLPFVNLIMACISSVSMQVMWNGKPTNMFWPSRGIRQGDLISPYLFVLCIERLAHSIKERVESMEWHPLRITRYGPSISHLFFADDLIFFAQASREQMQLINRVLEDFCHASGETISREKSVIFCSKSVLNREARMLSSISNFF